VSVPERLAGWRRRRHERIDPFTLGEPWRRLIQDALATEREFQSAVSATRRGPLRDRLEDLGGRVHDSVVEAWQAAQQGHALSHARTRIDAAELRRELDATSGDDAGSPQEASLRAQLAAAERMDVTIDTTRVRLQLLGARLAEAVTQAAELSVTSGSGEGLGTLGDDLSSITQEIGALREALGEVDRAEGGA
jgi:hypothetical protein